MYPPSNPEGYALIVPITTGYNGEVPTTKEILKRALQFQYCKGAEFKNSTTISPYLDYQPATRHRYRCTGIKQCEFLDNDIATCSHTVVNDALYMQIRELQSGVPGHDDSAKAKASSMYLGVMKRFQQRPCHDWRPECRPVVRFQRNKVYFSFNIL
ncbi:hypothetical protein BU23DRAFT_76335 [Bimuria novae-zelandiae CBS 107.79]|uniref:Uncharacterized protein n=1 Tax=Bimuria novae-zelandiae CBS 107.79 TaxID=1447943 RepID=A0A6A5VEP3_9PLEO|nr:hypothetical protein BU23DRAFT_76335 [Bimuria novae-zelandiae CBS 107.79]